MKLYCKKRNTNNRELNWGTSTADLGISEESAKKGLGHRREEIWDAAAMRLLI